MDIKLTLKCVKMNKAGFDAEEVSFSYNCSDKETMYLNETFIELLDNPVVQRLFSKFTEEVSFKPRKEKAMPVRKKKSGN